MKKIIYALILFILLLLPLYADSVSLNTEITTVSMGPHNFGLGLAPTGTNFVFYDSFQMLPNCKHKAYFDTRIIFSASNNNWFSGFNYSTGTPEWYNRFYDIKDEYDEFYIGGSYFKPEASVNLYLSQGFGTNPIQGSGPLVSLTASWNSTFSMALEDLDVQVKDDRNTLFIDVNNGIYKKPFGPGSQIQAYPWLQDTRNTLVNNLQLGININLTKYKGFNISDGVYINTYFEMAPKWLGNTLTMQYPTADYYKAGISISENLALYSLQQDNGFNWISIGLSHYNGLHHTGGEIVPSHKLPSNRLANSFSDSWTISFYGPQFIAWDCYSDISLSLNNSLNFGHVVNEKPQTTYATELTTSLSMRYHLRLFGFMHFEYYLNYAFASGIQCWYPDFQQRAKVTFYIAL